jgi:hypothetical protein
VSTTASFGWIVVDIMSTLSQAIHGDVVSLGTRVDELHVHTVRLRSHVERESKYRIRNLQKLIEEQRSCNVA